MQQLWVDRYRPRTLEELSYHPDITKVLGQLSETNDFPHMIFYGGEGVGKKARVFCFLERIFGKHVYKLKSEERSFKPENSTVNVEFVIFQSNYHIEITPSDNGHHDTHIIQSIVKEIASNANLDASKNAKSYKVLVIHEAEKLSKEAQGALRRTMEKYMKNCRMILICTKIHKMMAPIRSRCLNIRVPAPSTEEIFGVLSNVASKESKDGNLQLNEALIKKAAENCGRNLREGLIQVQLIKYSKNPEQMLAPYKKEIQQIAEMIYREQSVQQLKKIRDGFYALITNCIESAIIMKELLECMMKYQGLSQRALKDILHTVAEHERTLAEGSKEIYHLESLAAHVMEIVMISKSTQGEI